MAFWEGNTSSVKDVELIKQASIKQHPKTQQPKTQLMVRFAREEVLLQFNAFKEQKIAIWAQKSINACHVRIRSTATPVNFKQLQQAFVQNRIKNIFGF